MCEVGDEEQCGCWSPPGSSVSTSAENISETIVRQQVRFQNDNYSSEQSGVFPSLKIKASGIRGASLMG